MSRPLLTKVSTGTMVLVALIAPSIPSAAQEERATSNAETVPFLDSDTPRFDQAGEPDRSQLFTRWLNLDDRGMFFDGTWIYDQTLNLWGGLQPGRTAGQNLLNLFFGVDLEKAAGWEGFSFYFLFQNHRGTNAHTLTGDEQFFDQTDSVPVSVRGQISGLWIQKDWNDGKVRAKVGKMDANQDFAFVSNGNDFIHGAFGNATTIYLLPTYPDPSTGANLFLRPTEAYYAGFGIYDGAAAKGITPGRQGPQTFFNSQGDYFLIGEAGLNYKLGDDKLEGRLGLGYWHSTARLLQFQNSLTHPMYQRGTGGPYVVFDQDLWREKPNDPKDDQGIGVFYQFGWADQRVSFYTQYFGAGLVWKGMVKGRDKDSTGVGMAYSKFTDEPIAFNPRRHVIVDVDQPANEWAFQWFYEYKANDHLTLQPVVTYIHDPGQSRTLTDPLAITLRLCLDF